MGMTTINLNGQFRDVQTMQLNKKGKSLMADYPRGDAWSTFLTEDGLLSLGKTDSDR